MMELHHIQQRNKINSSKLSIHSKFLYSSDLKPIEMIWSIVKQSVAAQNPKSRTELIEFIRSSWDCINDEAIRRTIIS